MAVYVDTARHKYRGMIMCHMWADSVQELLEMADRIGVPRKWLQQPPHASWVHFDVCLKKKAQAISHGAILTDKYGPLEHVARLKQDTAKLARIQVLREKFQFDSCQKA